MTYGQVCSTNISSPIQLSGYRQFSTCPWRPDNEQISLQLSQSVSNSNGLRLRYNEQDSGKQTITKGRACIRVNKAVGAGHVGSILEREGQKLVWKRRQDISVTSISRSLAEVAAEHQGFPNREPSEEGREPVADRVVEAWEWVRGLPEVKTALQVGQFATSLLFVVLYVWATYNAPPVFSWRSNLDLLLCFVFAIDYFVRYTDAESKFRMVLSFWNILDLLAFLPPLLEACLHHGANVPFKLGRFDLRWFKILRALRVMRVSLLAGELRQMHLSSTGALLSGAATVRLFQLIASVLTLLFTTSSIIVLVERIPFHMALYFVTTTLTTVGFGDVVMTSPLGKAVVLGLIGVGVVLIPVQTSQLYSQLTARRMTLGAVPDKRTPSVLVSTRLSEVRGFSDFYSEFFQALKKSRLPDKMQMIVLCNRPNFEFRAFQELNDKRLTLMEGSALSERDLMKAKAEGSTACLLLADRFSSKPEEEDLNLQFQVWALKSYTKRVPLYVQVLQKSSIKLIAPFLDPEQDVLVSTEQTRHRLLALSCLCPGASTLIANLLRRAAVTAKEGQRRTAGGRRWLRAYLNGCAFKIFDSTLSTSLAKVPFSEAAEWLYRTSGFVLMGVVRDKQVILNPGRRRLKGGETGIVIGTSQGAVDAALAQEFSAAEPLEDVLDNLASTSDLQPSALRTLSDFSEENLAPIKKNAREAWNTAKKPVEKAADWMSTLKTALRVDSLKGALKVARSSQTSQKTKEVKKRKARSVVSEHDLYFYPEENMPCVLSSPYCRYESCDLQDRLSSNGQASTSGKVDNEVNKFVEGYAHFTNYSVKLEASESYDEEDQQPSRSTRPEDLSEAVKVTLKQFYKNLGDLTNKNRYQPGYRRASREAVMRRRKLQAEKRLKGSNGRHILGFKDAEPETVSQSSSEEEEQQFAPVVPDTLELDSHEEGVDKTFDMDVYSSQSIDQDTSSTRDKNTQRQESAIDLPDIMTESYDEDPEDDKALTLQQILSTTGHDNLHSELNSNVKQSVADHIAYASLEKPRAVEHLETSLPEGDEKAEPEDIEPGSSEMSQWTFGSRERDYRKEAEPDIADALPRLKPKKPEPETESKVQEAGTKNHIIMCGAVDSFVAFVQQLRKSDPISTPIVILHSSMPKDIWPQLKALGPVQFIQGNPSDAESLQQANASKARALVFLAHSHRPSRTEETGEGEGSEGNFASRTAVLADAQGLLTCYGVGEDGSANLPHAVVELCFTSSVRFLQPGLLLKGQGFMDEMPNVMDENPGQPRKSWQMRKRQEKAAIKEGLAEWQANPYYCAGRVTVPALMDTFACQCFFNRGKLTELMEELSGDDGRAGGAQLRQIPLPEGFAGKTYGELFANLTLARKLLPLGLYRRKSENSAWRLYYVVTNPPFEERLDKGDRVFVLRERGGPWLITLPSAVDG